MRNLSRVPNSRDLNACTALDQNSLKMQRRNRAILRLAKFLKASRRPVMIPKLVPHAAKLPHSRSEIANLTLMMKNILIRQEMSLLFSIHPMTRKNRSTNHAMPLPKKFVSGINGWPKRMWPPQKRQKSLLA